MEFSKKYREELCTDMQSLMAYHGTGSNKQQTYFFFGAVPDHTTLHAAIRDEWYNPSDNEPKAPDHAASSFNGQYAGKQLALLYKCLWETAYEKTSITNLTALDIAANTTELSQAVAVRGIYNSMDPVIVQGFDHTVLGDKTLTWALTLWGVEGGSQRYRAWYVLHRIGTLLDPDAELVVQNPVLTSSDQQVIVDQIYSPIF